jgi:voltage-gated potassium channel
MLRKRLTSALLLLLALIAVSVAGYRLLGGSSVTFLQALYMAVITLAGVGYAEVVDTSHNPALRVFNMGIVLFGVAITVYVFSVVAAFLVEIEITNPLWRRRMQRRIDQLSAHYIVCGLGDTGRFCVQELSATGTPHVVVELHEENVKKLRELHPESFEDLLWVIGDATEEEVLEKAGIARAKGLISALPHDKDNLVVTVVARQRFPHLRIVARSADKRFSDRMLRAGANATVSPTRIGGLRLASEAIRPAVVSFLDLMLQGQAEMLRVEELPITGGSPWAGLLLENVPLQRDYNLLVLAAKRPPETGLPKFWVNPPPTLVLQPGSVIIVMGNLNDIERARNHAAHA